MKIYFAASIRGGRSKQEDYKILCDYLKNNYILLTEHIGDQSLTSSGEDNNNYIYSRDVNWIKECDILVAEVTVPSLGVGYEIAYAEKLNKKILCIYDGNINQNISAMILGNKNLVCKTYEDMNEAINIISEYISNLDI